MSECPLKKQLEERLLDYLSRINNGEDINSLKEEFTGEFRSYSCYDIINAKEELVKQGVDTFPLHLIFSPHEFLDDRTKHTTCCSGSKCNLNKEEVE